MNIGTASWGLCLEFCRSHAPCSFFQSVFLKRNDKHSAALWCGECIDFLEAKDSFGLFLESRLGIS